MIEMMGMPLLPMPAGAVPALMIPEPLPPAPVAPAPALPGMPPIPQQPMLLIANGPPPPAPAPPADPAEPGKKALPDWSTFAPARKTAIAREKAAERRFLAALRDTHFGASGGEPLLHRNFLLPSQHITEPCYEDFRKFVAKHDGCKVRRRKCTPEEKKFCKKKIKPPVYFLDVHVTQQAQEALLDDADMILDDIGLFVPYPEPEPIIPRVLPPDALPNLARPPVPANNFSANNPPAPANPSPVPLPATPRKDPDELPSPPPTTRKTKGADGKEWTILTYRVPNEATQGTLLRIPYGGRFIEARVPANTPAGSSLNIKFAL